MHKCFLPDANRFLCKAPNLAPQVTLNTVLETSWWTSGSCSACSSSSSSVKEPCRQHYSDRKLLSPCRAHVVNIKMDNIIAPEIPDRPLLVSPGTDALRPHFKPQKRMNMCFDYPKMVCVYLVFVFWHKTIRKKVVLPPHLMFHKMPPRCLACSVLSIVMSG